LTAQAHAIIACDFLVVGNGAAQALVRAGVHRARHPQAAPGRGDRATDRAWAVQQARNLAMDLDDRLGTMRFLIHDHDPIFTTAFGEVFKAKGLRIVPSLPRTPRMNAICERVIRTLRRELLNRTLILGDRHLDLVLREYLIHYNRHRPHQSRQQRPRTSERSPSGT